MTIPRSNRHSSRSAPLAMMLAAGLLATTSVQATDTVTIQYGHVAPEANIYHWASKHFAEKAYEYSDGTVEINIVPGAQLGGDRDLLEGVQLGSVQSAYISLAIFEGITPVLTGFQMPFLIDNYDTAFKAITSDVAAEALTELEQHGIKALAIVENGMRVPGNNVRPIRAPEDFDGIRFRAPEADLQLRMFRELGATVTPMPFPEIYTALETGTLQGQDQFLQTWIGTGAYEVVDYMSITEMYTWPAVITMNLGVYERLSPEQQDAVQRAAQDAQRFAYEQLEAIDAESLETLREAGIQVETDVDLEPFMEVLAPIYEDYAGKHPIISETINTIERIKAE